MITQLDLHTFKCFKELHLPLAPLTLLSGGNASGKSTVLQSLVLLHQTMREHEYATELHLNGNALSLGSVQDVVDSVNSRTSMKISIEYDNISLFSWHFSGNREDLTMRIAEFYYNNKYIRGPIYRGLFPSTSRINEPHIQINELQTQRKVIINSVNSLEKILLNLTYISAERVGPREIYPLVVPKFKPSVGPTGEYTASVLYQLKDHTVNEKLLIGTANNVLRQVEQRMQQFFPDSSISIDRVANFNYVTLGLRTSPETDYHRPNNVGFGLTQVLPIIVATLTAKKGDLLLIENPEVHLHPAGQALMGRYLAEVASSGVQIILETHSDHILNGMRRAVKSGTISPTDVKLYFFNSRYHAEKHGISQVISPAIDKHGNLDAWPAGFFDQFDKDTNYFAGWGE